MEDSKYSALNNKKGVISDTALENDSINVVVGNLYLVIFAETVTMSWQ